MGNDQSQHTYIKTPITNSVNYTSGVLKSYPDCSQGPPTSVITFESGP